MYTYPRPLDVAYPARVLSNEGRFLEAILQRAERKLAGPGRPGTVDRLVAKVERREAPRPTSLGARGALPREVGTLILPPRVLRHCTLAPPAAPSPRAGLARDWQTSDALRRENAEAWLFESTKSEIEPDAATYTASYAGLTRVSITLRKSLSKWMDCRVKPGNDEKWIASSLRSRNDVATAAIPARAARCALRSLPRPRCSSGQSSSGCWIPAASPA